MQGERTLRHRGSLGIFEAALLLVALGAGLWIARPVPGARGAAEAERGMLSVLDAVADAEEALPAGTPRLPLADLVLRDPRARKALAGFTPSPVPGVVGNGTYWFTVLLPDRDGVVRGPGAADASGAARGFVVVAWPVKGASRLLRSLAGLPAGGAWQRGDGIRESGEPGDPPVPRLAFPERPADRPPDPPPDWVRARNRKGWDEGR